ncbi:MAG TPA: LysM domain-containing protein, partial [Acetobacteraceae bacterium]
MRTWLQRVRFLARPSPVALVCGGLSVALIVMVIAAQSNWGGPRDQSASSGEPPPQAAASAPEPTLAALQDAAPPGPQADQTPEPSPFAGIAQVPPEAPERTSPTHHTVTSGEVLWQIAEQYRLRPETVLWANDINDPDLLLVGQDLLIPPADGVLYTVRAGDSLADIANRYGVEVQSVVTSNQLGDADQIVAGSDIFLPGGRPLAASTTADAAAITATAGSPEDQASAAVGPPVHLPDNIDALLATGW